MSCCHNPPLSDAATYAVGCPEWAKETVPAQYQPFLGKFGLPKPWCLRTRSLGGFVTGVDRWQANHFVVYRPETAAWLERDYTPTTVKYRPGSLPSFERLADEFVPRTASAERQAEVFITQVLPQRFPHSSVPPLCEYRGPERGLDDEALLASGGGFCNEQARVFIRLCQVRGIQARLSFLFYSDRSTGHTTAEYWTGSRWAMVDVSWYVIFPGPDGHQMSSAECHGDARQRVAMGRAYEQRLRQLLTLDDEALVGRAYPAAFPDRATAVALRARGYRERFKVLLTPGHQASHLWQFGLLNYPLPS